MHAPVIGPVILLAAVAAGLAAPATAQRATQPPPPVARWLQGHQTECSEQRGRLIMTGTPAMVADFNGDRQPDYVVSEGMFECRNRAGVDLYAGNYGRLGPDITFLMSSGTGHRQVEGFNVNPYELTTERRGTRDVLIVEPSHGYWGDVKQVVWAWNGRQMEPVERRNAKGQLVDQSGRPTIARPAPRPAARQSLTQVSVRLTPRAQQRMTALREQVLLSLDLEANPIGKTPRDWYLDEITVSLGELRLSLPAAGGTASIPIPTRLAQSAGRIRPGSEIVRISVTSARATQADNLLNCAGFTGELRNLPGTLTINCDLIG